MRKELGYAFSTVRPSNINLKEYHFPEIEEEFSIVQSGLKIYT